ncbi:peptidoglycan recognition family protein [Nocardiopsis flavescens]|uniref:N-acetylmuramoyl-L-alanine amidase n=1 Tax=Nocardiopsis flavescens TaxID=758803 RepID=A0A1M6J7G8_9ACTN|nr:peptidoglycan recognition family protein [Nocardiopsis flavescens]SHJ42648.1 N-acetylmuramoyl-L-alanine amidase [Nocardiopsis flavescens]
MSHPRGPDRRTVLRGAALTTGATLLGGAALLGPASPAAAAPTVHARAAWGARPPSSPIQVLANPPLHIVVHHTATANSTDHSLEHALALSRSIQNHHMDSNGWSDAGQQLTISRGGHVMEGRDRTLPAVAAGQHVVGAHVANNNSTCIGIENEGTYTAQGPTQPLRDSLVETLAWLCAAYGLNPQTAILGHRDFNATACPGDVLYAMLPELRNAVSGVLRARGVEVSGRPVPEDLRPSYPDVPDAPWREFDHGPAHGPDDITR